MIRHEYSYWLHAKNLNPDHADQLTEALKAVQIIPDILVPSEIPSLYEVDPQDGTIEQVDEEWLNDAIRRVSAQFPEIAFSLQSIDEEDHARQSIKLWVNGSLIREQYARLAGIDNLYDKFTVDAAKEALKYIPGAERILDQLYESGKIDD